MSDLFERVRKHWQKEGAGVASATASADEIAVWERRYKVLLPADLRAYVTQLNGTFNAESFEFGSGMTSFLPLKAMAPEREFDSRFSSENMFVFADYLISSYWWCAEVPAELSQRTRIFVRGKELQLVADSLEEFLEAYIVDSMRIHPV